MGQITSLRETAAAWHDSLQRDKVTEETRQAFALWLERAPEHRAAYDAVHAAWTRLQNASQDPAILALRHETVLRLTRRNSRSLRPAKWAAAAAVVAVFGVLLIGVTGESAPLAWLRGVFHVQGGGRYVTETGERLNITLEDGSQVTLNTQTELRVNLTKAQRYVHLIRGQAIFEVARDSRRPFVVEADKRRLIAVGTAFDVRLDASGVRVTMIEGMVRVERASGPPTLAPAQSGASRKPAAGGLPAQIANASDVEEMGPRLIGAGEQLTADAGDSDRVRPADAERVTSWRRGQVIFENARLAEAVAELNRYSTIQVELADPALADLRLSGAFATGHPHLFVEAVTSYFPVQVARADDRAVVLSVRR